MPATSTSLLSLPTELRHTIWRHLFAHIAVAPFPEDFTASGPPHYPQPDGTSSPCLSCLNNTSAPPEFHRTVFAPLLTCRQIYDEANPILSSTFNLHLPTLSSLSRLKSAPTKLCCTTHRLTITAHLDDDNREAWMAQLSMLSTTFPHLHSLTVHSHMRPPFSYDALIDAIHLCGPLVRLPPPVFPDSVHIVSGYVAEYVMFENAFLGVVMVSDALEEHGAVIRDLLRDPDFHDASDKGELHLMTNCLLRIAREHQQPWFSRLQSRRREEMLRAREEAEAGRRPRGGGEGAGERVERRPAATMPLTATQADIVAAEAMEVD